MELEKFFPKEEIAIARSILIPFHDRILLDKKINDPKAVFLSIYMLSNELKASMVPKEQVKKLFVGMGRSLENFRKIIYELSGKRKGKEALVSIEKDLIGLNFYGLNQIKELLSPKEKK